MKRSIKNAMVMLLCGLVFWCVPVRADLIYNPIDMMVETFGTVLLVVGGAIVLIVAITVGLLVYLKKTKKKSQSEDKGEKL